ncbi:MAG: hypothetical protein R2815_11610 [Flavobacteriales bacterium]
MKYAGGSRDEVKERLLRMAAEVWNMPGIRTGQVDPLVNLLFGAMSLEVERIGHAIHDSDARVFERIARYLLPEVLTIAEPAHGIVRLQPEKRLTATRYEEMTYEQTVRRKENMNRPETREFCFSVAGDVPLGGIRLVCRVWGSELATLEGSRWTAAANLPQAMEPQAMYLGFDGDIQEDEVVRLYFDWPGSSARERCLLALPRITAHDMEGAPLPCGTGVALSDTALEAAGDTDLSFLLERRVRAYYHERFVRIRTGHLPGTPPESFTEALEEAGLDDPGAIRWLRIDLPSDISPQLLHEAVLLDQCVPVINRRLEKAIYRLQHELNIKQLDATGTFLGMEKAESNKGQTYAEVPSAEQVDSTPGSYTVRHGATARYDERDGSELLQHAVDQVREESRAFASMDVASTVTDLRSIGQALSRIERRLQETNTGQARAYVAMRPFDRTETAHLHYWTTDGEAANGIPAGTLLRGKGQNIAVRGTIQLVTNTIGARVRGSRRELVQQYRAAVLSRGRLVTRRDIMEHCRMVCGAKLKNVTVESGIMPSADPVQGLVRCLDITLTFDDRTTSTSDAAYFRERLRTELNSASALSVPLRLQ